MKTENSVKLNLKFKKKNVRKTSIFVDTWKLQELTAGHGSQIMKWLAVETTHTFQTIICWWGTSKRSRKDLQISYLAFGSRWLRIISLRNSVIPCGMFCMRLNSQKKQKKVRKRKNSYIVTNWSVYHLLEFKSVLFKKLLIANNYSAKWK